MEYAGGIVGIGRGCSQVVLFLCKSWLELRGSLRGCYSSPEEDSARGYHYLPGCYYRFLDQKIGNGIKVPQKKKKLGYSTCVYSTIMPLTPTLTSLMSTSVTQPSCSKNLFSAGWSVFFDLLATLTPY